MQSERSNNRALLFRGSRCSGLFIGPKSTQHSASPIRRSLIPYTHQCGRKRKQVRGHVLARWCPRCSWRGRSRVVPLPSPPNSLPHVCVPQIDQVPCLWYDCTINSAVAFAIICTYGLMRDWKVLFNFFCKDMYILVHLATHPDCLPSWRHRFFQFASLAKCTYVLFGQTK